jgi:signal transduction histidine kinase
MFAETLRLGRVRSEAEQARSLEIVDQEARRLTHLVENLLYFSSIERQTGPLRFEPVDLPALAREVAESFSPMAAARGVTVTIDAADGTTVDADRDATRQIVLNLVDNAVKYGPAGQTVSIGVRRIEGRARLWVDDQGPGIPEAARERIWERFWRLDRERTTGVAGTGIGLAIVRELAGQQGGRAWVETAPGGGARFVVEWKLA